MAIKQSLTFCEIDIPAFVEESPTPDVTFRFAIGTSYLPREIDAIPSIKEVQLTPAIISLGVDLGQRATLTVTLKDHRHIFADEDIGSGTFFGKFRARYGLKLRGRAIRLIRGYVGQTLADMETRHYLIESCDGPTPKGEYRFIAKDVLKHADGDRAQAPTLSNGFLVAGIDDNDLTATLSPTGIGNLEYPAAGIVAIGGKELVGYTRSGDVLTITRAQFNTEAQAHEAGDRVQYCYRADGATVSALLNDLWVNHANVPESYIPLPAWEAEEDAFLGTLYSVLIAEPTSVNKLISELIEQAGLTKWWDDLNEQIRMQVLRAISTDADEFSADNYLEDSLDWKEQPEKRISDVWLYFGKINPLVKDDEPDNYRSCARAPLADSAAAEAEYGGAVIKKIFSRWIPAGGRTVADRIIAIQFARYRDPPRRFNFDVMRYAGQVPVLGGGYQLLGQPFQDTTGAPESIPIQVTRINPGAAVIEVEAEEMLFLPGIEIDPTQHPLIFDSDVNNINLRTSHDALYPTPVSGDTVTATINAGIKIGSTSTASPAFDIGTWPAGVALVLIVNGRIEGKGGNGGAGSNTGNGSTGLVGGAALYTRQAIDLVVASGEIWSGGGGGGGGGAVAPVVGGGGGGAGQLPGSGGGGAGGGAAGSTGTTEAGGAGGAALSSGGAGGGPGLAGSSPGAFGGAGGAAGSAIDGISFVTVIGGAGDRRGSEIN